MWSVETEQALIELARRLAGCGVSWVVGGSTGLALRGAELGRQPRDLDIYADAADVAAIHATLANVAMDGPVVSETDRYRSVLSHYDIGGTIVELVGGFTVSALGSVYRTDVNGLLYPSGDFFYVAEEAVRLVPLGHELIFNLLREREDRAETVGRMIGLCPDKHVPALTKLIAANDLSPIIVEAAWRCVGGRRQ